MRHGAKRLMSLLTALVMVCSLAVAPAAAADDALPIVAISENQAQSQYIYANSAYNKLDRMTELAGNIKSNDNRSEAEIYLTIYANSKNNESAEKLSAFVQSKNPTYKVNGKKVAATWKEDKNRDFNPKGLKPNASGDSIWFEWYDYTADLEGSSIKPKAKVTVIPVEAATTLDNSAKIVKAADITNWRSNEWEAKLALPKTSSVTLTPMVEYEFATEKWKKKDGTGEWKITGWQMDGKPLTLAALKAKANAAASGDITITLTPVYDEPWATITATPTFKLTITPKTPVDVAWSDPNDITYGKTLDLGTPSQKKKNGGDVDETDSFDWNYVYYKADGTTKLDEQPTDAGTYKVQAVLNSTTHSGASEMKQFEIKPKGIDGTDFTFTPPAYMNLTYNEQPQTPEYIVKDGETVLREGTDYTVGYTNNANAGTATVTFTGKGNYTGTHRETFKIQKLALYSNQKPAIAGTAAAGQVLSASLSGVDANELEWTWNVDDDEADNCTAASYEVKPEDSGKTITVTAKAKADGNYSGESGASEGKIVEKVTVTGTVTVEAGKVDKIVAGTKLTATAATVPSNVGGTWSWKVDGTVKEDVGSNTYTVAEGDKEIIAVFTPGEDYEGTIESAAIEAGKAPLSGKVSVTGGTAVRDELTASVTNGPKNATFTDTWLRDGKPIDGATGDKYTITKDDRGKTIGVKVSAEGYTGELVSNGTDIPAAAPAAPSVTVTAGDKKLTINWTAPADNGGAPVTGYKLVVTEADSNVEVLDTTLAANVTSYTLENLTNNTTYTVSVKAVNKIGESVPGGDTITTPDEKTTTVETLEDGTVVTTVQDSQGYLARTEERPDGSILSTVHHTDGCNGTIETDTSGKTVAVADVPAEVAGGAVDGSAVPLPVVGIWANRDIDKAPAMVVNTFGVDGVKVRVPVENKRLTVVAVEIKSDGTPVIVKNTIPTEDGIQLRMNHLEVIRFLDNDKAFADTQDHWAADAVDFVSSRELFNGTAPNTFAPDDKMTRGMLVTVLARYEDVDTQGGATWYEKGADWAKTNGLSDGTRLNDNITREQLATIMYRYVILKGKLSGSGGSLSGYTDADSVSDWGAEAMSWAVGVGLINGTTPTTLDPQGSATRAQVAAILMRYAEMFGL